MFGSFFLYAGQEQDLIQISWTGTVEIFSYDWKSTWNAFLCLLRADLLVSIFLSESEVNPPYRLSENSWIHAGQPAESPQALKSPPELEENRWNHRQVYNSIQLNASGPFLQSSLK